MNIIQVQGSNWWRQFKVIVLADKLALVSLQALQETWEPDEWLRCCHLIPEFICVASMPTDSPLLTALYLKTQMNICHTFRK